MADCEHWEGDTINGYWLCAKCFAKLPERPRKYGVERLELPKVYDGDNWWNPDGSRYPTRQTIAPAPIAEAQGTTLSQFIEAMALRLIARTRGGFQKPDAMDYAVEILRGFGEPFGSGDLDWTSAGAWELVDEDLQHWDADEAAPN
jgi:homospermidine synthase